MRGSRGPPSSLAEAIGRFRRNTGATVADLCTIFDDVQHRIWCATVAQHFLLSAAAKTLSLASIARMSDDEATATFKRLRWADNGGEPYCPQCGCATVYALKSRPGGFAGYFRVETR